MSGVRSCATFDFVIYSIIPAHSYCSMQTDEKLVRVVILCAGFNEHSPRFFALLGPRRERDDGELAGNTPFWIVSIQPFLDSWL
jgi:hypothetical protein